MDISQLVDCVDERSGGCFRIEGKRLSPHQVHAAQCLMAKVEEDTPLSLAKASILLVHDTGLGKSISALLMAASVAARHKEHAPILFVCPVSIAETVHDTAMEWTAFNSIALVTKQLDFTKRLLRNSDLIITTPGCIVAAYRTFARKGRDDSNKEVFERRLVPVRTPNARRHSKKRLQKELQRGLSRRHPLFRFADDADKREHPAFKLLIVDEIHTHGSQRTYAGHTLSRLARSSAYTVGLTATPVCSKPAEASFLAKILDARPEYLQSPKQFSVRGLGARSLNRETIAAFHQWLVHRASISSVPMVEIRHTNISFEPHIGRNTDGTYSQRRIDDCNRSILNVKRIADRAIASASMRAEHRARKAQERTVEYDSETEERAVEGDDGVDAAPGPPSTSIDVDPRSDSMMGSFQSIEQYEFSGVLGEFGAAAFNADPRLFQTAATQPSEAVKLLHRVVRDRQRTGHPRIVVYAESVVMLGIARNHLAISGGCGRLFLFDGTLNAKARRIMIQSFLTSPRAVMFISGAGAVGTTICPGCETMVCLGALPWNYSSVKQAHGRVHRINQCRPVEIVQLEPSRSTTTIKLLGHADKKLRLEAAFNDEDFSHFENDEDVLWQKRLELTKALQELNERGNYDAGTLGRSIEAPLADAIHIPPSPFPVEGFVETHCEDTTALWPVSELSHSQQQLCAAKEKARARAADLRSLLDALAGGD